MHKFKLVYHSGVTERGLSQWGVIYFDRPQTIEEVYLDIKLIGYIVINYKILVPIHSIIILEEV